MTTDIVIHRLHNFSLNSINFIIMFKKVALSQKSIESKIIQFLKDYQRDFLTVY